MQRVPELTNNELKMREPVKRRCSTVLTSRPNFLLFWCLIASGNSAVGLRRRQGKRLPSARLEADRHRVLLLRDENTSVTTMSMERLPGRSVTAQSLFRNRFVRHRTKAISTGLNHVGSSRFKFRSRSLDETQADMKRCKPFCSRNGFGDLACPSWRHSPSAGCFSCHSILRRSQATVSQLQGSVTWSP